MRFIVRFSGIRWVLLDSDGIFWDLIGLKKSSE